MHKALLAVLGLFLFVASAHAGQLGVQAGIYWGHGHANYAAQPHSVMPPPSVAHPPRRDGWGYGRMPSHGRHGGGLVCPPVGSPRFLELNPKPQGREGCQMVEKVPGKPCGGWWCPRTQHSTRLPGY